MERELKERARRVFHYHERTKHRPDRAAASPGYLDWTNEPSPFRRYEGTIPLQLPLISRDPEAGYGSLYVRCTAAPRPLSLSEVAALLELSMGLSAWKSYRGSSWALRINPSSGNLHPTEAYLVLPALPGLDQGPGVFHYNPYLHALEPRARLDARIGAQMAAAFGSDSFLLALSSIPWREAWKYGERAYRYCNHDVGHAVACLSFAAALQGRRVTYLNALSDSDLERLLGFDTTAWNPAEVERPDLLLLVSSDTPAGPGLPEEIIREIASCSFAGSPNLLSAEHRDWPAIDEVAEATEKPRTAAAIYAFPERAYAEQEPPSLAAAAVIRKRRSGQAYDGTTRLGREAFFSLLDKTLPRHGAAPFDAAIGETALQLLLFVHRVEGLEQGLYFFPRAEAALEEFKARCRKEFLWKRVEGTSGPMPLYLLERGDCRDIAALVSCRQDIAGDGVFAAAMIARFGDTIEREPYRYRHLHWEAGMIGQVLYLEAEARGIRGTGIGCFFDDVVHELLGLADNAYQSLYHFTVGGPIEDTRLTTLPPYHHLGGHLKGHPERL